MTERRVAHRIKLAREACGMSQSQVGALLDPPISYAAVSDIERGKTEVKVRTIMQLATVFCDVTGGQPEWFLYDESRIADALRTAWLQTERDDALARAEASAREAAAMAVIADDARWLIDWMANHPHDRAPVVPMQWFIGLRDHVAVLSAPPPTAGTPGARGE